MSMPAVNPSALRNARHMRHAVGFYPTEKDQENAQWFLDLNDSCVEWLKEMKISGKNARKNLAEMSKFASGQAQALVDDQVFQSIDEAYTMTYATLLTAVGSFERFLSSQRKREMPGDYQQQHPQHSRGQRDYPTQRRSSGAAPSYHHEERNAYRTQHHRR
jgi:hypothetical protein